MDEQIKSEFIDKVNMIINSISAVEDGLAATLDAESQLMEYLLKRLMEGETADMPALHGSLKRFPEAVADFECVLAKKLCCVIGRCALQPGCKPPAGGATSPCQ